MSIAPSAADNALERALADHRAGRLPEAETGYRQILAFDPDNAEVLHLMGVAAHQRGRPGEAIDLIRRALELSPDQAHYLCNLGEAHRAQGKVEDAIACQRRALELDPELAEAHNNHGLALERLGRRDEARASYERALALNPTLADAQINLGNLLTAEGRPEEAALRFERALDLVPDSPYAHYNLANLRKQQGRIDPALAHYRQALALDPTYVEAHNNLGIALAEHDEPDAAIRAFQAAVALDPRHAQAHNNLGFALLAQGDIAAARACFERALAADPDLAQAHNNLGKLQQRAGDQDAAMASFGRAVALDPGYTEARVNLGHQLKEHGRIDEAIELLSAVLRDHPDHPDATAELVYVLQHACQWRGLDERGAALDRQTDAALAAGHRPGETPFGSLTRHSDPARHLAIARGWADGIERHMARTGVRFEHEHRRAPKARLRIGYLSRNFRDHPVAHQIWKLFQLHDRAAFEIRAYSYGDSSPDPLRARIAGSVDNFVDLADLSDVDAAKRIHRDGVDLLVDLTGFTRGTRPQIAALRPAPIQVSYLGFLGTSGGSFIDYVITDPVCTPAAEACWFTEKLVHLPDSCLVLSDGERPVNRFRRLDFGLPEEAVVFTSLNATHKIEPVMFDIWMAILRAVPDSILWLYRSNERAVWNLKREAQQRGVAGRRLLFTDRVPYQVNLERLQLADIGLDTRVYNGGLTTANGLLAGVPVLTLEGSDFVSRMAASMLHALGLPELVAGSLDGYREHALALARDPARLAALRGALDERSRSSSLFQTERFARRIEQAYRAMWEIFRAGDAPRAIAIEDAVG